MREVQRILGHDITGQRDPPDEQEQGDNQQHRVNQQRDQQSPDPDLSDVDVSINTVGGPNKYGVVEPLSINVDEDDDTESDIEQDTVSIPLDRYHRDEYRNERVLVDFECIHLPPEEDRIRQTSLAYLKHTVDVLRQLGYDAGVSTMTVVIHPEEYPKNRGLAEVTERNDISQLVLCDNIMVMLMYGNHRYEGIGIVRLDMLPRFDWSRRPLEVVVTMRTDGLPMSRLEFMKTGTLLNNVSSHSLPVTEFLEVLASCLRFARAFTETL